MNHITTNFSVTARANLHCVALALCLLFLPIFGAHAQSLTIDAYSQPQDPPQAAATIFYGWYLGARAKDLAPPLQDVLFGRWRWWGIVC
jgi:ubiquinone biosynthesis protein Coq4